MQIIINTLYEITVFKKERYMMKKLIQTITICTLLLANVPTQLLSMHCPMITQELAINNAETKAPKKTTFTRIKKALLKFTHKRSTKITAAAVITVTSIASLAAYVYTHPEEASAVIAAYTFHTSDAEIANIHASVL